MRVPRLRATVARSADEGSAPNSAQQPSSVMRSCVQHQVFVSIQALLPTSASVPVAWNQPRLCLHASAAHWQVGLGECLQQNTDAYRAAFFTGCAKHLVVRPVKEAALYAPGLCCKHRTLDGGQEGAGTVAQPTCLWRRVCAPRGAHSVGQGQGRWGLALAGHHQLQAARPCRGGQGDGRHVAVGGQAWVLGRGGWRGCAGAGSQEVRARGGGLEGGGRWPEACCAPGHVQEVWGRRHGGGGLGPCRFARWLLLHGLLACCTTPPRLHSPAGAQPASHLLHSAHA